MIINKVPALRRDFAVDTRTNSHKHEGKFGTLDASGDITLSLASGALPLGVISEPDSATAAAADGKPGATLICHTFGGIVTVQAGSSVGSVTYNTLLKRNADGTVASTDGTTPGDLIVARSIETLEVTTPGQLFGAVMLEPYIVPAAS